MTLRLREQDLEWREIDDEIVVLDARDAAYLAVSGSGILIWNLLCEPTEREALIQALVNTYDIDQTRAGEDVDAFLTALVDRGLLAS
jgi:hypothetical protein